MSITLTDDERKERKKAAALKWYHAHKNDQSFVESRERYLERSKAVRALSHKEYQSKTRDRLLATKKAYRDSNPVTARLWTQARRKRVRDATVIGEKIREVDIQNWESKVCGICAEPIQGKFHLDHIIPLFRGGLHTASNLQLAHPRCNLSKGHRLQN